MRRHYPFVNLVSPCRSMARRRRGLSDASFGQAVESLEARQLLSAVSSAALDSPFLGVEPTEYASTHVLVRFRDGAALPPGLRGEELMAGSNIWKVDLERGQGVEHALEALSRRSDVLYAQPDYKVSVQSAVATDYFHVVNELWGLRNSGKPLDGIAGTPDADIDADDAWALAYDALGGHVGSMNVAVAIIDTGIDYTHRDLYLNIWINQAEIPLAYRLTSQGGGVIDVDGDGLVTLRDLNHDSNAAIVAGLERANDANSFIDGGDLLAAWSDGVNGVLSSDGSIIVDTTSDYIDDLLGWDFHNNDNNPMDDESHGTHVAGTIGGLANNSEELSNIVGVAWEVSLMGLKFLDAAGNGSTSNAIKALDYAVKLGIRISNNSWGGAPYEQALYDAIARATGSPDGHLFIASAGNGDWRGRAVNNDKTPHYPSNYVPPVDSVLTVAATDHNDRMTSFSNYGATTVDLAAPGARIWSTIPVELDTVDFTQEGLRRLDGTSMAAPHVAGAAALIWSIAPHLTALQVKQILMDSVDPIGHIGTNSQRPTVTNGRLNAHAALQRALAFDAVPPSAPTSLTATAGDGQVSLSWTSGGEADLAGFNIYRRNEGASEFVRIATVSNTAYVDVGVQAGATYHYLVTAFDQSMNESEASNEASVTLPEAQVISIASLTASSSPGSKKNTWDATVVVGIVAAGAPLSNATVYGQWISSTNNKVLGQVNGQTNASGSVSFVRTGLSTGRDGSVIFRVTNVVHPSFVWDGTLSSITISQPVSGSGKGGSAKASALDGQVGQNNAAAGQTAVEPLAVGSTSLAEPTWSESDRGDDAIVLPSVTPLDDSEDLLASNLEIVLDELLTA